MEYYKKYLKYKKKYVNEKFKMIGGAMSECLFVDAHGKELPNETINLKEIQMVMIFYKPFCSTYSVVKGNIMRQRSTSGTGCSKSHYITLQEIFNSIDPDLKIILYEDMAIYSGNKYDVDFFNLIRDDENIRKNDISIVPNIIFKFEDGRHKAYSFPVSESSDMVDRFNEYHEKLAEKYDFLIPEVPKEHKHEEEHEHGILLPVERELSLPKDIYYVNSEDNKTIDLKQCLDKFNFVLAHSCRDLDPKYYLDNSTTKKIGVPFIIFLLYSYYRIIVDILGINREEIDEYDRFFYNKVKYVFENYEYSKNREEYTTKFYHILIETIKNITKVAEAPHSYHTINKLSYVVSSIREKNETDENARIIDILQDNAKYLDTYIEKIKKFKTKYEEKIKEYGKRVESILLDDCILKHMYILAFFIEENIDNSNILNNITHYFHDVTKEELLDNFILLNYNKIKNYDFDDIRKIKHAEYLKSIIVDFKLITLVHMEKLCYSIKELSKHYYNLIRYSENSKHKYQYKIIRIPKGLEKILDNWKEEFNMNTLYNSLPKKNEIKEQNIIVKLIKLIDFNVINIRSIIIKIYEINSIDIKEVDTGKMMVIKTIKDSLSKMLYEKCINMEMYIDTFNNSTEDLAYTILKHIEIDEILLKIFSQNDINIIEIE